MSAAAVADAVREAMATRERHAGTKGRGRKPRKVMNETAETTCCRLGGPTAVSDGARAHHEPPLPDQHQSGDEGVKPLRRTTFSRIWTRFKALPTGAKLMLSVFTFCGAYSIAQLVQGITAGQITFVIGGVAFAALSVPLIIIAWQGRESDQDDADPRS